MENIVDALKEAEVKQESLRKSLDQLHGNTFAFLSLTLQWKDLEAHFESTKIFLLKQAQELDLQEKKLEGNMKVCEQREKEVDIKLNQIEGCNVEHQMMEKQLGLFKKWTHECESKLNSKKKQLRLYQKEVQDCDEELSLKKEQLRLVQEKIEECNTELAAKEKELGMVGESIKEFTGEIELKERKLCVVQKMLVECCREIDVKGKQMGSVQKSLDECSKELEINKEEAEKVKKLVTDSNSELKRNEEELKKVRNLIGACNSELEIKEKQLKRLQEKDCELDLKKKELGGIQKSIDECLKELDLKKKELNGTQELIKERLKELDLKGMELSGIQKLIKESSRDIDSKQKHLESILVLIEENRKELAAMEKRRDVIKKSVNDCFADLKSKGTELGLVENTIKKQLAKLLAEEKTLDSVQRCVKWQAEELESKEEELNAIKEKVKAYYEDLKLKEKEINDIQMSIEDRSEELKLKEKELKSVQTSIKESKKELKVMKDQQNSFQKSIAECSEKLESKEKVLDLTRKSLKECCDELELKEAQLDSIRQTSCEFRKEVEEKEKKFYSLKKALDEHFEKFGMNGMNFEKCVKEFALKEKMSHSMQKSGDSCCKEKEVKEKQQSNILNSQVWIEQPENLMANSILDSSSVSLQSCITGNGRNLKLILNEHLRKHDLVHGEVFSVIQKSPDPAKLVLDALKQEDMEFELSVTKRSCITLLELLLKLSPQINPEVREQAMKLAWEWNTKRKAVPQNFLELLGFLQLVAAFKLSSSFSADELRSLLDSASQHSQAIELQQALGITDNMLGSNMLSSQVKIELPEHSQVSKLAYSSANFQSNATAGERDLPLVCNKCVDKHALMQHDVSDAVLLSPDLAKFVLDVMKELHSQHWKNEATGCDASVMRSKVILLEQLMKISPQISPQVKEAAKNLAVPWKANIRLETGNSMEVFAFLLFLAVYGLGSYFRNEDILGLIGTVAHQKQTPRLCQALGLADEIPDFIQNLIQRKQHLEAARFTYAFGLINKFPPELILEEYLKNMVTDAWISNHGKNSLELQSKAMDKELVALRSILECIADYKPESRFLADNIMDRIVELEKKKAGGGHSLQAPAPMDQSQLQGLKSQAVGISGLSDQPAHGLMGQQQLHNSNFRDELQTQNNNKRPRIDD